MQLVMLCAPCSASSLGRVGLALSLFVRSHYPEYTVDPPVVAAVWRRGRLIRRAAATVVLLSLMIASAAHAESGEWQFGITPYLWLPYVDANLGFETGGSGGSTVDMTDVLKHLRAALFLNVEARRGKWGLSFDLVYCDFSKSGSQVTNVVVPGLGAEIPLNAGTTTDLTGSMLSLMGSYTLTRSSNASLDLLAGVRYLHIGATLDWSFATAVPGLRTLAGSAETGVDVYDGVVGVRGRVALAGSPWFVPFYLDAGTGTSKFTWQGLVGIGYAFGWGDVLMVYRQLAFDENGAGGVQHLSFSGPALGATFRF